MPSGEAGALLNRLIYILDDDPAADICASMVRSLGCRAEIFHDVEALLEAAKTYNPDAIFLDELSRGVNGIDLSRRIREDLGMPGVKLVILEKQRSDGTLSDSEVISDARLVKPYGHGQVLQVLSSLSRHKAELRFWGVRGSIPSPGGGRDRYGGNTSCVTLRLAINEFMIFDAGTGIRAFGNYLIHLGMPVRLHMMISHSHWDHIQGLPFFRPAYLPENDVAIYGPNQPDDKFERVIADQMKNTYFPVPLAAMQASLHFHTLNDGSYEVGGCSVQTMHLNHPGSTIGYRVTIRGQSVCYMCDNEITDEDPDYRLHLQEFMRGAQIVVADAQYVPADFPGKLGWGHSKYVDVVDVALGAGVQHLLMTHHDPDRSDEALDAIAEDSRLRIEKAGGKMRCSVASEGTTLYL